MADLIKPSDLQKLTQEKEIARAHELLEADKRRAEERQKLQDAIMNREIHKEAKDRVSAALRAAAERGETQLQVFTFPSELCSDGGRAINNGDRNWPDTLAGFPRRAYDFYKTELQPFGYKLKAEIINFPGGMPGEVAITLTW